MRILGRQQGGVQSFGRHDVSAPGRIASAEASVAASEASAVNAETRSTMALTKGIVDVTETVHGMYQAGQQEEATQRMLDIKKNLDVLNVRTSNQKMYDLSKPEDVEFLGNAQYNKNDASGQPRTQIDSSEVMAQAWGSNSKEIMKNGLAGMSDYQQGLISDKLRPYMDGLDVAVLGRSIKSKNDYMRNSAQASVDSALEARDLSLALKINKESTVYSRFEKADNAAKIRTSYEKKGIELALYSKDGSAESELTRLQDPDYEGFLTGPQRATAITALERSIKEDGAAAVAGQKKRYEMNQKGFELAMAKGQPVSEVDILNAVETDQLTPIQGMDLRIKLAKQSKDKITYDQASAFISSIRNKEIVAIPGNKEQQEAIDLYVAQSDDPQEIVDIAVDTSYVPEKLKGMVDAGAINGDVEMASTSLSAYMTLSKTKPHMTSQFAPETQGILDSASVLVRAGASHEYAIEVSRAMQVQSPEQLEQRKLSYKKDKHRDDNLKKLNGKMDADQELFDKTAWYSRDVDPNDQMAGEFNAIVEAEYYRTGDVSMARDVAYERMRKKWGISGTGGHVANGGFSTDARPMPYAPERLFNTTPANMNMALRSFSDEYLADHEKLSLYSDRTTAVSGVSWAVWEYDDATGNVTTLKDIDGQAVRFHPADWLEKGSREEWYRQAEAVKEEAAGEPQRIQDLRAEQKQKAQEVSAGRPGF